MSYKLFKKAQIYCSSQTVPDTSIISDITYLFLDACYSTKDEEPKAKNTNEKLNGTSIPNGNHH
jgi:hypothetical protein